MSARAAVAWCRRTAAGTFGRSALVGLLATVADLGVLWLLIEGAGAAPGLANVPGLIAGLLLQFVGNKYFAFADRSPLTPSQVGRFAAVEAVTFALNLAAFHLLAVCLGLPFVVSRLAGEGLVYVGYSSPRWRRIFAAPSP